MKQDRFLLTIVCLIGLLVIIALVLFFTHRGKQNYQPEGSPQAVVHNYVLALQKEDYTRAYGYLAEGKKKPTLSEFRHAFIARQLDTSRTALQIGNTKIDANEALVSLTLIQSGGGPFDDTYRMTESAILIFDGDVWKLSSMPHPYWNVDWYGTVKP